MATLLVPLESNPDAFNAYLRRLGVCSNAVQFVDVYGVSDEMLDMVPRPVYAVLLVFPIPHTPRDKDDDDDNSKEAARKSSGDRADEDSVSSLTPQQLTQVDAFCKQHKVVFMKQTVGNMCGTVALLHAVLNNMSVIGPLDKDSCLEELVAAMRGSGKRDSSSSGGGDDAAAAVAGGGLQSADALARLVETNDALLRAHTDVATSSSLNANNDNIDMSTSLHFVCYVCAGGRCVELDGRRAAPLLHGACGDDADGFLRATAAAIRDKMAQSPNSYEYNIMAMCAAAAQDDRA